MRDVNGARGIVVLELRQRGAAESPDEAFQSLALQVSHVRVQLSGQREQRPASRTAVHDLSQ
jgi:hypothetical protein